MGFKWDAIVSTRLLDKWLGSSCKNAIVLSFSLPNHVEKRVHLCLCSQLLFGLLEHTHPACVVPQNIIHLENRGFVDSGICCVLIYSLANRLFLESGLIIAFTTKKLDICIYIYIYIYICIRAVGRIPVPY